MKMWVALVALSAACAAPGWAHLPEGEWRTARPIALPARRESSLVYLPLDAEALAGVRSLSEYRVVEDGRVEAPYQMVLEEGRTETRPVRAEIISKGASTSAQTMEVLLDLGDESRLANRLGLKLSGDNFRAKVLLEGLTEPGRAGMRLGEELVYRHEGRFEQDQVVIPPHDQRYLRLTVSTLQGKLPTLTGVAAAAEVTVARRLERVPATMARREDRAARATLVDLDLPRLTWDLAEARFEIPQSAFDRPVSVFSSRSAQARPPEEEYGWALSGKLRRVRDDQAVTLPLAVEAARHLRIRIENGDDRPLPISAVELWRTRRGLVFRAEPGRSYDLWYGRPGAPAPVYDIARLPLTTTPDRLPLASLGPARTMPLRPPPPAPWSERHPVVFWAVLALVILLMAWVILRALRSL